MGPPASWLLRAQKHAASIRWVPKALCLAERRKFKISPTWLTKPYPTSKMKLIETQPHTRTCSIRTLSKAQSLKSMVPSGCSKDNQSSRVPSMFGSRGVVPAYSSTSYWYTIWCLAGLEVFFLKPLHPLVYVRLRSQIAPGIVSACTNFTADQCSKHR